jgi:hypothetical protein
MKECYNAEVCEGNAARICEREKETSEECEEEITNWEEFENVKIMRIWE